MHDSSGTLTSNTVGFSSVSVHNYLHEATGSLTTRFGTLSGADNRFRQFGASGAIVAQIGSEIGSSNRFRAYGTAGVLKSQVSWVSAAASKPVSTIDHLYFEAGMTTKPDFSVSVVEAVFGFPNIVQKLESNVAVSKELFFAADTDLDRYYEVK